MPSHDDNRAASADLSTSSEDIISAHSPMNLVEHNDKEPTLNCRSPLNMETDDKRQTVDSSDSCGNVTFLENAFLATSATYFVIFESFNNIRTSLEIVLSTFLESSPLRSSTLHSKGVFLKRSIMITVTETI